MIIASSPKPRNAQPSQPTQPAQPSDKTFSYNAQDSDTLPTDTVTLPGVTVGNGMVSTDTVTLAPKKAIIFMGQILGLRPDPKYKLNPNEDGNFIFPQGDASLTGANSFSAVAKTVNKFNEKLQELTGKNIEWAFKEKQLGVSPETGETPNAFYARDFKGVHFFHYKTTSTADSGEAVSHETGHAILDALRPGYLQGSGAETGAFHEAFGDIMGMLMSLQNEETLDAIVAQTGGDLSSKRNILADTGEGFGHAIGKEGGIRTAYNDFVYADPATLPENGDDTHLGHEVHSLSRLWSGAFYDVLDGISDANRAAGMSPKDALRATGEEAFNLLVGQMEHSGDSSETTFKEMAQNLMAGDAEFNGGKRQDVIHNAMVKRGLMDASAPVGFMPIQRSFKGEPRNQELTFGADAGQLAGVKMNVQIDQPSGFGLIRGESSDLAAEATKGAKLLAQDGKVLFLDHKPEMKEIFQPDGSLITAYVAPNAQGEKEFHRVPIAF